jgi:sugar phosphate isomerase/epimerase
VQLGYNTNGFAHHRLEDAFEILSAIGYSAVAVTIEHDLLDPPDRTGVVAAITRLRDLRDRHGVSLTIETGARFILDPRRKHQPTLLSGSRRDRERRREYLSAAIDIAAGVGATCVSFWSGAAGEPAEPPVLWARLEDEIHLLLEHAEGGAVRLALEPEPGMFIETMDQFERLHAAIGHELLGLTLDVGHVYCLRDGDTTAHIERWQEKLFNVHIEDMNRGAHQHLMFGEGEMDFGPIFESLRNVSYAGPINVELSRHSHDAVAAAHRSFAFLGGGST